MPFKSGADWNGNKDGRKPKEADFRIDITRGLVDRFSGRMESVVDKIITHAENDKLWALKLCGGKLLEIFYVKPKAQIDIEAAIDQASIFEGCSPETLEKIRPLIEQIKQTVAEGMENGK